MTHSTAPSAPRLEHRTDAGPVLGLGVSTPRISWSVPSAEPGWKQVAYEVDILRGGIHQTYVVTSGDQVLVPWPAPPLRARERAEVRVRVSDSEGWSPWGDAVGVEAGLLHSSDWTARFISPGSIGAQGSRAPVLQGAIDIPGVIRSARLYATAHGIYVPRINGHRVDDTVLAPGWTSYEHRLRYHAYDVTELVQSGTNVLEVLLGNGWYRGRLGFANERAIYGDRLALLAQLEVTTTEGAVYVLATDGSWQARESEILTDDLYDGQSTDLRLRDLPTPSSDVEIVEADMSSLVAADGPPIRPTGILPAQKVWTAPSGATLVDFGQNAVGWIRLRVRGLAEGTTVVVRHAEALEHGELGTRPLRTARATDSWVLSGGDEVLEPSLTLHGFQYAEVVGVPGLQANDIELVVVGSDLRRTGWFSSSHRELNQFHENVVWSTRGNFIDMPIDCPQRDERLGWTGDIQIFGPTAVFLYDTAGLLRSWLADLAAEQLADGAVPHVIPDVNRNALSQTPAAGWGDAAAIVPWTLYQRTGDLDVLRRQFDSMRGWVDRITEIAGTARVWRGGFQYGDWLDPTAPPDDPYRSKSDPDAIATAHFARSSWIVAESATLLGLPDVAEKYRALSAEVRAAFAHTFVTPGGRVLSESQTVYALAIEWNLLPLETQRREAGLRLADLVRTSGFRISTGFIGTPLVCDALASTGHLEVAYRLLFQTQCPSWLYPVTMGATTVWERWDSMLPDGSLNPGEMTSFNHYALGAVADWLHRMVGGLAPLAPGYRRVLVHPRPNATLTHAGAKHLSPYGEISVSWERSEKHLQLEVSVPVGVTAEVHVPGVAVPQEVGHGEHAWVVADPVPSRPAFDWDRATIRDLLDDPVAWAEVVQAAAASGAAPEGDAQAAGMLVAYLDWPAALVARALAPEDLTAMGQDMRRRLTEIVARMDADSSQVWAAGREDSRGARASFSYEPEVPQTR